MGSCTNADMGTCPLLAFRAVGRTAADLQGTWLRISTGLCSLWASWTAGLAKPALGL
jgi:hypothetical protein